MVISVLLLTAVLVIPGHCIPQNASYFLTMIPQMETGKEHKICMTLFKHRRLDVHYTLQAERGQKYFYQRQKYRRGRGGCITFTIPKSLSNKQHNLQMSVIGPRGLRIHDTVPFVPISVVKQTYIQTDKPVYKPGQLVRMRIMTIDSMLMTMHTQMSFIRIKTPNDVIMKQWRNVTNEKGLVSLEYQLAAEPVLGKWTIVVSFGQDETEANFEVKEYVLPKFSITIKPPVRVNEKTETIDGEVCVKYTYGQPVKGKIMVDTCVRELYQSYEDGSKPCAVIYGEITGCFNYSFNTAVLRPYFTNRYNYLRLSTFVAILEEATGLIVNQTQDGPKIQKFAVRIDIKSYTRRFFKPLLPFEFRALVVDENGKPAPDQVMTIWCEDIGFRKKMVSDKKGFVTHFFPRLATEKPKIRFNIVADDNDIQSPVTFEPTQWFSPSDSYLEIQPISKLVKKGIQPIVVYMTKPPPTPFRAVLQVMSRGRVVYQSQNRYKVRKNPDGSYRTSPAWCRNQKSCITDKKFSPDVPSITVFLDVTCEMSPEAQVLVYYLTNTGEIIADTEYLKIEQCFSNKVNMAFSPAKEYPGYPTKMSLSAAPGSVCGLGVVDQSVFILGGKNQLSPQELFSQVNRYNAKPEWQNKEAESEEEAYCLDWLKKTGLSNSNEVEPPKSPYYYISNTYRHMSEYVDSQTAFRMANLKTHGALSLRSRPCKKVHTFRYLRGKRSLGDVLEGWQSDGSGAEFDEDDEDEAPEPTKKTAALRQYFPETWLWDIEVIGDTGKLELNKTLPGSITEWVGSVVCASPKVGVGVSESASVTAFQPFFLSFTLPYAAIRGEHIPITVSIFNYLTECMEVELRLNDSTEFELINPERVTWMCICGNDAKRHDFVIIPKKLGFINITATAKSIPGDSQCPNVKATGEAIGVRDAVVRQLLVEPEGDEKEYTYSTMVCQEFFDSVDLPLFSDQVPDSGRGVISVIGDLMGPSFTNMGSLLRVPYGCGEQNMLNFAPNVFIMRYLKAVNKLTPEIEGTIDRYLGSGYQRELNYMRSDGSFSAFGNSDSSGSTWLTAFVIKSFTEAQPFLDIDQNVIRRARVWLKSKQQSNGCFKEVGRVIHSSMRGGVDGANSIITLTSYVLGALLTAGTPKDDFAVKNAINCIVASPIKDVYTVAAAAYSTALYDVNSRVHVTIQRDLHSKAVGNDTLLHWEAKSQAKSTYYYRARANSLNVETTAYALLAYLEEDDLESSLKIVKWLEKQRNPQGGFASTQDTVVALHALSVYSLRSAAGDRLKMAMTVQGEGIRKNFITTDSNRMVMQTEPLKVPNEITVSGTGSGCALFKATVRYNTYSLKKDDLAFTLNATVHPPDPDKPVCSRRSITVCTAYVKGGSSGMAIVNAKLVTGWVIDTDTLERLKNVAGLGLKRYEIDEKRPDNVHFYFDELNNMSRCLSFDVNQEIKVENTKEAVIQVYDYYDTELVTKVFYSINDTCGAKSSKPSSDKMPKTATKPRTAAPDAGLTGMDKDMDIDKADGDTDGDEGSGVLDKIDPIYLADGLRPQPNSIPVVNLNALIDDIQFSKDGLPDEGAKKDDGVVEVRVRLGSTAILPCPLRAKYPDTPDRQYKLAWIDELQTVIAVLGNRIVDNDRMSVVDANLRIDNVTQEDSGKYQCQVNTVPVQSSVIILKAQDPPRLVFSSSNTTVAAGTDVALMCNATGIPKPKVMWYHIVNKSVQKKHGKGGVLMLNSVQTSSEYRCVVSNGVPPDVTKQIKVTVNTSSPVTDQLTPSFLPTTTTTVTVTEGEMATLPCVVRNLGTKSVSWRRAQGNVLTVGQYVFTDDIRITLANSVRKETPEVSDWKLLIRKARQSDSGVYECQISSKMPQTLTVTLVVTADEEHDSVPPWVLPNTVTRVGGIQGSTGVLQVHVMASPPVLPRWSRRGRALTDDRYSFRTITVAHNTYIVELRINNLESKDFDDYTCEIVNGFGVVSGVVHLYDITPTTAMPTTVQTVPPFVPVGCPVCVPMSEKQAIYAYCQSKSAYKVLGLRIRNSRVKVKILADLRPLQRVKVRRVLRLVVDSKCKCDVITALKSRTMLALFMNRNLNFASKPREVILGSETIAMVLPKATERRLILSRKKCT